MQPNGSYRELLPACLDDLERRLDPDVEERLRDDWLAWLHGTWPEPLFRPRRLRTSPPGRAWPAVHINDAQDDMDAMALSELAMVSAQLAGERDPGELPAVRCNYGTAILPSLHGVEPFPMARAAHTLPGSTPLGGQAVPGLLAAEPPDLQAGLGGKTFAMARRFRELLAPYPKLRRHVHIGLPDVQGPLDILELVWGSGFFYALVDDPDTVHAFLDRATDLFIAFCTAWFELAPPLAPDWTVHRGWAHRGLVRICDDSAMNLSPEMFAGFVLPYDARILERFGGFIHACGRVDHYTRHLRELPGLAAFNLSQPQLNDMERVFADTVDQGIRLLGLDHTAAQAALDRGRDLHGLVHCR